MGGEILIYIAAGIGLGIFVFLVAGCVKPDTRPYALPTLVLSVCGGVYASTDTTDTALINVPFLFFSGFFVASLVFGAQAHAIRWLNGRNP
jgi:hypothetical protein